MDAEKTPEETTASPEASPAAEAAPQDALERTNDDLGQEAQAVPNATTIGGATVPTGGKPAKKPSKLKAIFHKFNVYLLLFVLVVVIAVAVSIVSYLNSKKQPSSPTIATQQLTADALKQLANSDATVGNSGQTLTVQGNAIFSGQVLVRSDLNVAGSIKLGGDLLAQNLTASGIVNLANTQINSLQVANASTFQGTVTIQHDLNVGGATAFSGPITAGQITVTKLVLSGNAQLQVPNHIAFTGASPSRTIDASSLGSGGSASVNGSDTSGTVNVNTGNSTNAGCFITLTFSRPFSTTPYVIISPVGAAAGQMQYYVNRSATSFSICTADAAPANKAFGFDYFISGS